MLFMIYMLFITYMLFIASIGMIDRLEAVVPDAQTIVRASRWATGYYIQYAFIINMLV